MTTTIITKNSSTAGAAPLAADLVQGELAVNVTSKALYTKNASAAVVKLNTPSIVDNGDATAITIDSSENVGVGTSSPSRRLQVQTATTGNVDAISWSDNSTDTGYLGIASGGGARLWAGGFLALGAGGGASFTERARIDTSGNLLVAITNIDPVLNRTNGAVILADGSIRSRSNNTWSVGFASTSGDQIQFWTDNGTARVAAGKISSNGATTTYGTGSDYRMKEDILPMVDALEKVMRLNPVSYRWKTEFSGNQPFGQGFIAHELQEVVPAAVIGEKDATHMEQYEISPAVPATFDDEGNELTSAVEAVMGEREVPKYQSIDTSFLVATLTAAIQEQQTIIDAQASVLTSLTARIEALEAK